MNCERTKENTNNKNANREKRNRLIATHEGEGNKKHSEQSSKGSGTYLEIPIKATHIHPGRVPKMKLQTRVVKDVDDRTNHRCAVAANAIQKRFHPA